MKATAQSGSSSACKQTYGVLPCTDTIIGNLFLLCIYGYFMYMGARLLSEGSELLLAVLKARLIGGLLLPVLGAFPDSILILVSGIGGTQAEAQEKVLVGIGLLAGSNVFLLTLLWGSCLILGRCDLDAERTTAIDKTLSHNFGFIDTGVENGPQTMMSARIMILTVVPFLVAQVAKILKVSAIKDIPVLIACVLSLGGLVAYCLYQVFIPWIQELRRLRAQKSVYKLLALERFMQHTGTEALLDHNGELNTEVAKKMFQKVDRNSDGLLPKDEVLVMLCVSLPGDKESAITNYFMKEFDENQNQTISETEFLSGMQRWLKELKVEPTLSIQSCRKQAQAYFEDLLKNEDDDNETKSPPTKAQIIRQGVLRLVGGSIMAAIFADPLVDAVKDFSNASRIPSFFISFVVLPFASNSSEAVSSILFSMHKRKKDMTLTYSQIYGGVTMNNTLGLGIFLALVYGRQLLWQFSAEVVVICLVIVIMGLLASFRKVFPLWMAGIALLLYPLSLGLVAILDYLAGWE